MNNTLRSGILFVVSAPAGAGKTTLVNMLTQELTRTVRSVSSTTRAPRHNEQDGVDYHFLTQQVFTQQQEEGAFLESATVFGNSYGTSQESVDYHLNEGRHVILVIDTEGALTVKKKRPDAVLIFILPPSLEELKRRLLLRGTDSLESITKRVAAAQRELEMISHYDYHVPNGDLSAAYNILKSIVIAEENRIKPL
ncbi:MAG: guanylate kinase [Candidatus Rhabdochlamydia sp.]